MVRQFAWLGLTLAACGPADRPALDGLTAVSEPLRARALTLRRSIATGINEASDLVMLPSGKLAAVSDTSRKLSVIDPDTEAVESVTLADLPKKGDSQLEAVAFDAVNGQLYLSREESHEVWRLDWSGSAADQPTLNATLDVSELGGPKNQGLEGLVFFDGQLLAAKEKKPQQVVALHFEGVEVTPRPLSSAVLAVLSDFSALTVDPKSGHLFIASNQDSSICEVTASGTLVASFALVNEKAKPLARIEGLAFGGGGELFVLTENDGIIRQYAR